MTPLGKCEVQESLIYSKFMSLLTIYHKVRTISNLFQNKVLKKYVAYDRKSNGRMGIFLV